MKVAPIDTAAKLHYLTYMYLVSGFCVLGRIKRRSNARLPSVFRTQDLTVAAAAMGHLSIGSIPSAACYNILVKNPGIYLSSRKRTLKQQ